MKWTKMIATKMKFKEVAYDEEGNVKHDKHGNVVYNQVERVVRHNSGYYPKK